jgi:hypothetical protein
MASRINPVRTTQFGYQHGLKQFVLKEVMAYQSNLKRFCFRFEAGWFLFESPGYHFGLHGTLSLWLAGFCGNNSDALFGNTAQKRVQYLM